MGARFSGTSHRAPTRVRAARRRRAARGSHRAERRRRAGRALPRPPVRRPRHPQQAPTGAVASCCACSTLRRVARVVSLLALDFVGVVAGDLHRAAAQGSRARPVDADATRLHGTEAFLPFAYLLTALLFARSGLYAERGQRPGLVAHRRRRCSRSPFVALIFARRQRRTLLQLLPLLRLARVRDLLRVRASAPSTSASRRCCCAPPATSAARCSSAAASTSTTSPTRSPTARTPPIEVVGFVSPTPLPDNGLRSLGTLDDLERVLERGARRRGDHRRPRLPAGRRRSSSSTSATGAASACASRRRRWRS